MDEVLSSLLALRRLLKSHIRSSIVAISSLVHLIHDCVSYLWSLEIPEDLFFVLLFVIPTIAAYLLDRFDRELSDEEIASQQSPPKVAFKSPTQQSEEVWEKYDQLQQSKASSHC